MTEETKVTIKDIPIQECTLYREHDNEVEYIGTLNEYQFHDVRVQIMEKKLKGYFCIFEIHGKSERLDIDSNGRFINHKDGMFDTIIRYLTLLLCPPDL